jgi:hypothetical protein
MAVRKENSTGNDREPVSRKTAKKTAAGSRKNVAVTEPKVTGKKSAAAPRKKTAARENPPEVKPRVARKRVSSKSAAAVGTASSQKLTITREERHRMICEAAYLISSKRPPCTGTPEIDWVQAEAVIDMVFDSTE